jgi:hypothetical protein
VLVTTPRLLDADRRTLEAIELVDGVSGFIELAKARDHALAAETECTV